MPQKKRLKQRLPTAKVSGLWNILTHSPIVLIIPMWGKWDSERFSMKYHAHYDVFARLYRLTLLGGEFANCHGQGPTIKQAEISLKLTINVLRKRSWLLFYRWYNPASVGWHTGGFRPRAITVKSRTVAAERAPSKRGETLEYPVFLSETRNKNRPWLHELRTCCHHGVNAGVF